LRDEQRKKREQDKGGLQIPEASKVETVGKDGLSKTFPGLSMQNNSEEIDLGLGENLFGLV
jgi:hypothetical protein